LRGRLLARAATASLILWLVIGDTDRLLAAPAEKLLPLDQYSSAKFRELAGKYADDLRALATDIYHCIPWLEVQDHSLGFFRPKDLGGSDGRYLSMRVFIEQEPSADFARLTAGNRAAAMYARYVGPLLKRMGRSQSLNADPAVEGFTIILDWLKQSTRADNERPVSETIAVHIDKASALAFLAGRETPVELANRAVIQLWDGETSLGHLHLTRLAEDDFVSTHKMANYQLAPGVTCP
jgi:hypothetical protein